MEIVAVALIGLGVIGLFGNIMGAGTVGDPSPGQANARFGCFAILIALGAGLWWFAG